MREYQKTFKIMYEQNKDLFDQFQKIHDAYAVNPDANKTRFNEAGREVTDVIRDYERRLCSQMGKGMYSKFTQNLSEKFWGEVRNIFPKIDFVGVQ